MFRPALLPRPAATGLTATLLVAGAVLSVLPWWWNGGFDGFTGAAPGGTAEIVHLGRVTGLLGGYLLVVEVALVARTPWLETRVGADRVTAWHRWLGEVVVVLLVVHAVLLTIGYGIARRVGTGTQLVEFVVLYAGGLTATVGTVLLVVVGVSSLRAIRRRLGWERWHALHVLAYAGIGWGFLHQLTLGWDLSGARVVALWTAAHVVVGLAVLWSRVAAPLVMSFRHRLRVTAVRREGPDAVSVVVGGRLEGFPAVPGQFLRWRFAARGLWGQAHPYSLSAAPGPDGLRFTVRTRDGDHGARLAALRPGTRVVAEGPSGALGEVASGRRPLLLVGAGIGVTPLRALLEAPRRPEVAPPILVQRASSAEELLFADEVAALGVEHVTLVGAGAAADLDDLRALVPDLADRTAVVCGPEGFMRRVRAGLVRAGVPRHRIHTERFRLA